MTYELFPHLFEAEHGAEVRSAKARSILQADICVCISRSTQDDVLNYYDIERSRTRVVPLGVSSSILEQGDSAAPDGDSPAPFFLYVGSRAKYKNFDLLLRAYSTWEHRQDVQLVVAGATWTAEEKQTLIQLSLQGRVKLVPHPPDRILARHYRRARFLVYPSSYEGFGIPLVEALASGCPVVASDIPSTREVVGNEATYIEDWSIESIADALTTGLGLREAGHPVAEAVQRARSFSWDTSARQMLDIYHDLLPMS